MKRTFYIFTPGKLRRKENTVFFTPFKDCEVQEDENLQNDILLSIDSDEGDTDAGQKRVLPINDIDNISIMTEASVNSRFLDFCTKFNIPVHFFNYYGYYNGSYYPREHLISGSLLLKQAASVSSKKKRLVIAKKFVDAAAFNINKNLKYYNSRGRNLQSQIDTIDGLSADIEKANAIDELMGIEGNIRRVYYTGYEEILGEKYRIESRKYHPPTNPVNAVISFANSLVYTAVLSEIYKTQLNPSLSFLHQPGERRFSLALDIAEIFKPIYADRIIFKLINNEQISVKHFDSKLNGCFLKTPGRKTYVREFDNKMNTTIMHRKLGRKVSYKRLMRLECYKLIKHLIGDSEYEPFKIWW
jgi:CRISPR-associated protein Cas1